MERPEDLGPRRRHFGASARPGATAREATATATVAAAAAAAAATATAGRQGGVGVLGPHEDGHDGAEALQQELHGRRAGEEGHGELRRSAPGPAAAAAAAAATSVLDNDVDRRPEEHLRAHGGTRSELQAELACCESGLIRLRGVVAAAAGSGGCCRQITAQTDLAFLAHG